MAGSWWCAGPSYQDDGCLEPREAGKLLKDGLAKVVNRSELLESGIRHYH